MKLKKGKNKAYSQYSVIVRLNQIKLIHKNCMGEAKIYRKSFETDHKSNVLFYYFYR